jgi:spore maturation protein CgeB
MTAHRILYLGEVQGTCLDRAQALRRLGHDVVHLDLRQWLPATVWVDRVTWRIGGHVFGVWLAAQVRRRLAGQRYDLVHVDNGEHVSAPVLRALRELAPRVINYNIDDPTGPRDRQRFEAYRRALPGYDLVAVVREENVAECRALGARHVVRVWRTADEINHAPRRLNPELQQRWQTDVLFLGTWMPERGGLLKALVDLGVPLTVRGSHWQKAPEWPVLRACWQGDSLAGDDYALALQCARVSLGLVSLGNRDQHTTRSLEIPALGGLLCAQRTPEHQQMYQEGTEAVFWSDARECAQQVLSLLSDEPRRQRMAQAGHARFLRNRHGNQDVMQMLLDAAWRLVP